MLIVDSQVHLWEPHRSDRPWPAESLAQPVLVAVEGARPHRESPLGADEFVALMDRTGVDRAIVVPPALIGDHNLTALEAAAAYPERLAVMGRIDLDGSDMAAQLEHWLEQPGMLGIRLSFHKQKWSRHLYDGHLKWFWRRCEQFGIPIMMLIPGLLDKVEEVARSHPDLTIILDHMARRSELRDDACFADIDQLLMLARYPNISVKMSAAPCYSTAPYPFANLTPYLRRIYDRFGPTRTMWGSDYTRLPCSYRECLDHVKDSLDFLGADDKEWVLGKAVLRLLDWK